MYKQFTFDDHKCLVFEKLGCSLYDYLKQNDYQPFSIECIRSIAFQLLSSLRFLHDMKLIHTDLKPENILFVEDQHQVDGAFVVNPNVDETASRHHLCVAPTKTDIKRTYILSHWVFDTF